MTAPRKKREQLEPCREDVAELVAQIIGEHSASAVALAELKRRRSAGELVYLWRAGDRLIVGPAP